MLPAELLERYRQIIIAPVVTEKTMRLIAQTNTYTFRVHPQANKIEIRRAVEALFGVRVTKVRTFAVRGKRRRYGFRYPEGHTSSWKKALVTLVEGDRIDVVERG
ncbi:MAG: 50S ribosomal protein L23 [Armatimonadetes bacterium]|nr:50S ribosomal protein L23 [Armatimonadota bacterium]